MTIRDVRLENFNAELHLQRFRRWLRQPYVARWWGDPGELLDVPLGRSKETHAVIVADGAPVGYLCWQVPPRDELEAAGLTDLPEDLVDIDIMIGEPEATGHGVGPRALELLLARLRTDPSVSWAGLATSVKNERAIRAFEKVGFRLFRVFQDPEAGPCRYMVASVAERASYILSH